MFILFLLLVTTISFWNTQEYNQNSLELQEPEFNIFIPQLSEKNIELTLKQEKQYEVIDAVRQEINFGEPIYWTALISNGCNTYPINYTTPPISLSIDEKIEEPYWFKNITLTTEFLENYTNVEVVTWLPQSKEKIIISPSVDYKLGLPNLISLTFPELNERSSVIIRGTISLNEAANTTFNFTSNVTMNFTLNETLNKSLQETILFETSVRNVYNGGRESWPIILDVDASFVNLTDEIQKEEEELTDFLGYFEEYSAYERTDLFSEDKLHEVFSFATLKHRLKMGGSSEAELLKGKQESIIAKKNIIEKEHENGFKSKLEFDDFAVQSIEFNDLKIENNTIELGLKEIDIEDSVQGYAIDPERLNFTEAIVTVIAKGTTLYKCKDWDFANENCDGEWELFKDNLIIGEEYTFILTPDDPAFVEVIEIDTCYGESWEYTAGTFGDSCDYSDGSSLFDGGTIETHSYGAEENWGNLAYGGVKISTHDNTITNCNNIEKVNLCYEWWVTGKTGNCNIKIDADNGSSYTTVSTTCPLSVSNPGVTCVDVTLLESWKCSNFFDQSNISAFAFADLTISNAKKRKQTETVVVDVLFFNVTYNATNNAPYWSNNQTNPTSGNTYSPGEIYYFNITWQDEYGVDLVQIEHNFAGTLTNYTVNEITSNSYSYNYSNLAAGSYVWRMFANDTDGKLNQTPQWTYVVNKSSSVLSLLLNGAEENKTIYNGDYINITAHTIEPLDEYIYLYKNGTLINSGNETLINITLFDVIGIFNITLKVNGSANYSANQKSFFVTVQDSTESIPPEIIITSPENGTITKDTLIDLDATTNEPATCRYSNISSFNFSLGVIFDTTGEYLHHEQLISPVIGNHTYYVKCNDTKGNINNQSTQKSVSFTIDRTAPETITNLINVSKGFDWIYWTWTNPIDSDFNNSIIYINAEYITKGNLTFYNATSLQPSTSYTINIQTEDNVGNINTAYIANITSTLIDNAPTIQTITANPKTSYFGEAINFTANVTDDFGIDSVWLIVEGENYAMINTSGNGMYYYNDYSPPETSKVYSYTVYANDTYKNSSKKSTFIVVNSQETTYYEHAGTYILNTSSYAESQQTNQKSFANGVETLGWTFDLDNNFGSGGMLFNIGNLKFSGAFRGSVNKDTNVVYMNWQLVELNSSSDEIIICQTPTGTNGELVSSTSYDVLDSTCTLTEEYYLAPDSKLRLKIYGYRSGGNSGNINHAWDASTTGSTMIINQLPIGLLYSEVMSPENNDQFMANMTHFDITCEIDCLNGSCLDVDLIIQGRDNATDDWYNLTNFTSPIRVNHSLGHPVDIGDVVSKINESVTLLGTSVFNDGQLRCYSIDRYNQSNVSDTVYVDIIPPDYQAPILENITNESITDNSAYIKWDTSESSDSLVTYGPTVALGYTKSDAGMIKSHSILLDGLNPTTTYFYKVKSCDLYSNCNESKVFNFTTISAPDLTAPIITHVNATSYPYSAQITWDTDEGANSTVNYGLTTSFGSSERESAFVTSHSITLINLQETTLYYFNVSSCDSSGNCNSSTLYNFTTTSDEDPVIHNIRPVNNTNHLQHFNVDIKVNITDDDEIDKVYMNISFPGGSEKFELTDGDSDGEFTYLFTSTSTVGRYDMSVEVNDTYSQNDTSTGYFNVIGEVTKPSIFDWRPLEDTHYLSGVVVEVSVNATDESGISVVLANINWSTGSETLILVNHTSEFYNLSFTNTTAEGRYDISFVVNDTNNNINNTESTYFYINDTTAPYVNITNPYPPGKSYNQTNSVNIIVDVTDAVEIDKVFANVTWNNSNNYQLLELTQQGTSDNYTGSFTNTNFIGIYNITILANDTTNNLNNTEKTWFNVTQNLFDVLISDIIFPSNLVENQVVSIQVNITNNASFETSNFNVKLNISLWNGTRLLDETKISNLVNLSAQESKLISFNWVTKIGTYIFEAEADVYDNLTEKDETNNIKVENISVSAWEILYGNFSYRMILSNFNNESFMNWSMGELIGNSYFADTDASYFPSDLMPLNGTNDLDEADIALEMTWFNDSISNLFDRDGNGVVDNTRTIKIGSTDIENIPIINSTDSSTFITGLLYDSADGASYDGNQDLVFVTKINVSQVGKYGVYDYEVKIPSKLEKLKSGFDVVERLDELV